MRTAVDFSVKDYIVRELQKAKQAALDAQALKVFQDVAKGGKDWVLIGPVTCDHETPKALLVRLSQDSPAIATWIPKSQLNLEENEIAKTGDTGMLVIPEWLAKEKGWL